MVDRLRWFCSQACTNPRLTRASLPLLGVYGRAGPGAGFSLHGYLHSKLGLLVGSTSGCVSQPLWATDTTSLARLRTALKSRSICSPQVSHVKVRSVHPPTHREAAGQLELLALLRAYGPATATELARRIGEVTSGTTSYHLWRLADHGYVREVAEPRSARDRCWQAADSRTMLDTAELLADPKTRVALETLRAEVLNLQLDWLRAWLQQAAEADPAWLRASAFSDRLLRLTPARLAALAAPPNGRRQPATWPSCWRACATCAVTGSRGPSSWS
jgi:DNA-binding transcriptional ArsR family regulator